MGRTGQRKRRYKVAKSFWRLKKAVGQQSDFPCDLVILGLLFSSCFVFVRENETKNLSAARFEWITSEAPSLGAARFYLPKGRAHADKWSVFSVRNHQQDASKSLLAGRRGRTKGARGNDLKLTIESQSSCTCIVNGGINVIERIRGRKILFPVIYLRFFNIRTYGHTNV